MEPLRGGKLAALDAQAEAKLKAMRPQEMTKKIALPCTACRNCVSHCPKGLDIPSLLEFYNEHCFAGGGFLAPMALMVVPEEKRPNAWAVVIVRPSVAAD